MHKSKCFFILCLFSAFILFFGCSNSADSDDSTTVTYSITYDGNGNTGGSVPADTATYAQGASVTVLGNTGNLAKTYNDFAGWNTKADGSGTAYSAGGTFSMGSANVTLYAQWNSTYSITYDGNGNTGGSVPADTATYAQGASVTVLGNTGNLAKTYNDFAGWNTKADGSGTAYSAGGTFSMGSVNVTLYAQWNSTVGTGGVSTTAPSTVTVTLTPASSTVTSGTAITATVTTSATVDSYAWYLDGSVVTGQTTASFSGGASLASGPHTLMVVVRKDSNAYSASTLITVQ